jgi:RNA polymerase sigma-70 factor (ECF subfamily)
LANRRLADENCRHRAPTSLSKRGKTSFVRSSRLSRALACLRRNQPGPFQFQAAIAAVHAEAPTAESTDWSQIIALYDQLYVVHSNPVVALNRSVAVAELRGPAGGLAALSEIDPASLDRYQPYHAARADLLARAGFHDEADAAYDRAIKLTTNALERDFLVRQRAAL